MNGTGQNDSFSICPICVEPIEWKLRSPVDPTLHARCWDAAQGIYVDYDLVAGAPIPVSVAAGFAPLFAGVPSAAQAQHMYGYLNSPAFYTLDEQAYPVPSYDRREPGFFSFDLLMSDGKDLRTEKMTDRKQELRRLMSKVPESRMRYADHIENYGTALFSAYLRDGS